ncbi:hypothetical protein [Rhizobium sp. HT1-10]
MLGGIIHLRTSLTAYFATIGRTLSTDATSPTDLQWLTEPEAE